MHRAARDIVMTDDQETRPSDLTLLDPERIRLFAEAGVPRLTLAEDRSYLRVHVYRAFPLSSAETWWGVLDGGGGDIGMIPEPSRLDAESLAFGREELEKRYFLPKVTRVNNAREEFGTVIWDVETDRGPRTYMLRGMKDSVIELGGARLLITDVDGNRFEIPDMTRLPARALNLVLRGL
jgi:hypothetical protein